MAARSKDPMIMVGMINIVVADLCAKYSMRVGQLFDNIFLMIRE